MATKKTDQDRRRRSRQGGAARRRRPAKAKAVRPRRSARKARVADAHGAKEALAKALAEVARPRRRGHRRRSRRGSQKASNQQLLRLQRSRRRVKQKYGNRDKLIAAIGTAEKKTQGQGLPRQARHVLAAAAARSGSARVVKRLVLAVALSSFGACRHEAAAPISNSPVEARPGWTGNDLDLIPADVELVVGINWSRATKSPLYAEIVAPQLAPVLDVFRPCHFDPLASLTSLTFGMRGIDDRTNEEVVAVVHGLPRDQTVACIEKLRPELEKDGSKLAFEGDVVTLVDTHSKLGALEFVDDHTAVLAIGPHGTPAGLAALAKQTTGLRTSPAFVEMYGKLRTSDALWGLINGTSRAFRGMPVKLKALVGSLDATDSVAADVHLIMDSPADADQLAGLLRQQASQIQAFVDRFDISAVGAQVDVKVAMSHQKVSSLSTMLFGVARRPAPVPLPAPPPTP